MQRRVPCDAFYGEILAVDLVSLDVHLVNLPSSFSAMTLLVALSDP